MVGVFFAYIKKISLVKYKNAINLLNERKEFIGKCRHSNINIS